MLELLGILLQNFINDKNYFISSICDANSFKKLLTFGKEIISQEQMETLNLCEIIHRDGDISIPVLEKISSDSWIFYKHNYEKWKKEIDLLVS